MSSKKETAEETKETETTELATTESNLPVTQPFNDGLGEITQDDLIIPRLKVGQSQSEGDVAGKLYIDVTSDVKEEMELVLIKLNKSRVLFPEKFSRDSEPLCRSQNFVTPENDSDVFSPMSETCADCAYSKWSKNESGKASPPRCQEVWNMLVLDFETFMPCWFSLKSTALKPARKIISMLKLRGTAKRIPAWGFKFTVEVTERSGDSGNSYIPSFSSLTELDGEDRENMNLIQNQLAGEQASFDEEQTEGDATPAKEETDDNF